MTIIGMFVCLALLVVVGYFFYCCAVTIGLWVRARREDRYSSKQYQTITVR